MKMSDFVPEGGWMEISGCETEGCWMKMSGFVPEDGWMEISGFVKGSG